MNKILMMVLITFFLGQSLLANADNQYEIRADGLACPYCAYGVEKKFNQQVKGLKRFDIDLKKGLVTIITKDNENLSEDQFKQLFNDAGFTYRSMKKSKIGE